MKNIMFDIDGTLIKSVEFDEVIFVQAVKSVTGLDIESNWHDYPNVTDTGLLRTLCKQNDMQANFQRIHDEIKKCFIEKIRTYLQKTPAQPIPGANSFLSLLRQSPDYKISFATGGWRETAVLKLNSAAIAFDGVRLCSSDDDYRRTHIMQKAAYATDVTYFGDAAWDKKACAKLGYKFIAVGSGVDHTNQIDDFSDVDKILSMLA